MLFVSPLWILLSCSRSSIVNNCRIGSDIGYLRVCNHWLIDSGVNSDDESMLALFFGDGETPGEGRGGWQVGRPFHYDSNVENWEGFVY